MALKAHILIVEARFYQDIADNLVEGALEVLEGEGLTYERITVPGALEIPGAIKLGALRQYKPFDAYVALGCVIRGETAHYDVVAGESARALMDLSVQYNLPVGNGILTCETRDQAIVRADPRQKNKGADATKAALALLRLKYDFGV